MINFFQGVVLAIDKPYGWTSFDVVAAVRRQICIKCGTKKLKVGHAGTLDPLATGVMILCTGRATRLIDSLQSGVKTYEATLGIGATTPSFDLEHPIDATYDNAHVTLPLVQRTLPQFIGDIRQVPPIYSACKVQGKRAYDLARKGQEVTLQAKPLQIDDIEILSADLPSSLTLRITCSKGTYIRALARDIGTALQSGAHLTALRRTQVGAVTPTHCFTMDTFAQWLALQTIVNEVPENQSIAQQLAAVYYHNWPQTTP